MEKIVIIGEEPLQGTIEISGSKNASLPLIRKKTALLIHSQRSNAAFLGFNGFKIKLQKVGLSQRR